jgi:hypothetical protein
VTPLRGESPTPAPPESHRAPRGRSRRPVRRAGERWHVAPLHGASTGAASPRIGDHSFSCRVGSRPERRSPPKRVKARVAMARPDALPATAHGRPCRGTSVSRMARDVRSVDAAQRGGGGGLRDWTSPRGRTRRQPPPTAAICVDSRHPRAASPGFETRPPPPRNRRPRSPCGDRGPTSVPRPPRRLTRDAAARPARAAAAARPPRAQAPRRAAGAVRESRTASSTPRASHRDTGRW